jgi:hypothetical protein
VNNNINLFITKLLGSATLQVSPEPSRARNAGSKDSLAGAARQQRRLQSVVSPLSNLKAAIHFY